MQAPGENIALRIEMQDARTYGKYRNLKEVLGEPHGERCSGDGLLFLLSAGSHIYTHGAAHYLARQRDKTRATSLSKIRHHASDTRECRDPTQIHDLHHPCSPRLPSTRRRPRYPRLFLRLKAKKASSR